MCSDAQLLDATLLAAGQAFEELNHIEEERIPPSVLQRAQCLVVLPGIVKAAFFAGGNFGFGVASCRVEKGWSMPAFVSITGGSVGFQIGVEESDLVLLLMDDAARESLLLNQLSLGVDAGISAGPNGEKLHEKTNAEFHGIFAYSKSWGVFAGVSFEGAVLRPDIVSNQVYYGKGSSAQSLLVQAGDPNVRPNVERFTEYLP